MQRARALPSVDDAGGNAVREHRADAIDGARCPFRVRGGERGVVNRPDDGNAEARGRRGSKVPVIEPGVNDAWPALRYQAPQAPERPQRRRALCETEGEKLLRFDGKERLAREQGDHDVIAPRALARNQARQYALGAALIHGRDEVEDGGWLFCHHSCVICRL